MIDLDRRFRDLTDKELDEPELLAHYNTSSFDRGALWEDILERRRVVLLAPAGAGKSEEMKAQVVRLRLDGKTAFLMDVEALSDDDVSRVLLPADLRDLESWRQRADEPAWLLLDAADDLALKDGKLSRALGRIHHAFDGLLDRLHVVISSRPQDWRVDDAAAFEGLRAPRGSRQTRQTRAAEEVFMEIFGDREAHAKGRNEASEDDDNQWDFTAVLMLPLGEAQIERFARENGVPDTEAFMREIERKDAWLFARRPLDLIDLVNSWKAGETSFRPRAAQHDANVSAKLGDRADRADKGAITDAEACEGAERLALALTLMRCTTIRAPGQLLGDPRGVVDARHVLPEWTEQKRQALLRRGLFDPATYGRIRFHHRSVQEYLAARRLHRLRDAGLPVKAVLRVLFAPSHEGMTVIPSRRPIAAWLALWDKDVLRRLIALEPEALLTHGDPESLQMSARADVLRAFAERYGAGTWRGVDAPIAELRRLAHPDLAPVIAEIWAAGATNPEVRELMLKLVWQGALRDCVDIARVAAFDAGATHVERIVAVRALIACDARSALATVARSVLDAPELWPDDVVLQIVGDLFPSFMGADALVTLVERIPEQDSIHGFGWGLRAVVRALDPLSAAATALREGLARLIWENRDDTKPYQWESRFDHVAPVLAMLTARQWVAGFPADADSAWAAVVAQQFGAHEIGMDEPAAALRAATATAAHRRAKLWAEVRAALARSPDSAETRTRLYVGAGALVEPEDFTWLVEAIVQGDTLQHRFAALEGALTLAYRGAGRKARLARVGTAADSHDALKAEFARQTSPADAAANAMYKRDAARRKAEARRRTKRAHSSWWNWRHAVIDDPASHFSRLRVRNTTRNIYRWLELRAPGRGRYDVWDFDALSAAFGEPVAQFALKAFKQVWRSHPFTPDSLRPEKERNQMRYIWMEGLVGLGAESVDAGWAKALSAQDAALAADYASAELNGFARWTATLAAQHPAIVEAQIGRSVEAEWKIDVGHMMALQNLSHADPALKALLAPRLLDLLKDWSAPGNNGEMGRWVLGLEHALDVVTRAGGPDIVDEIATLCRDRYLAEPYGPFAVVWVSALFRMDPAAATEALEAGLRCARPPDASLNAIKVFASLFGRNGVPLRCEEATQQAELLGRLLRLSYDHVRPEHDQHHRGSYTPDTRDDAQHARSFLFNALLETPGYRAWSEVTALAPLSGFAHFADRIRLLAHRRASADAEPPAATAEEVAMFGPAAELPARGGQTLFQVMLDRLDDLQHELRDHPFSERRMWREVKGEVELQRALARRLEAAERGAYIVAREEESADGKKTDVTLTSPDKLKAVIEVKIGAGTTALELEAALETQLLGQYLRAEGARSGCLLVTNDGRQKTWSRGRGGDPMTFSELIDHLSELARKLEERHGGAVRLAVFGLDLTDAA